MRSVVYNVAASLDGFIADAAGRFDWIPEDPAVDFGEIFAKVDTVLIGRRSYEDAQRMGGAPWRAGMRVYLFSRTAEVTAEGVTVVRNDAASTVAALRAEQGEGEIWLFGGSTLFATLLAAGLVDRIDVTVVPILLGGGTPLAPPAIPRTKLALKNTRRYPSGMVTLSYDVPR